MRIDSGRRNSRTKHTLSTQLKEVKTRQSPPKKSQQIYYNFKVKVKADIINITFNLKYLQNISFFTHTIFTQFLKADTQQKHTPNLQNHALILCL